MESPSIEMLFSHPQHLPVIIGCDTSRPGSAKGFVEQQFKLPDLDNLARFIALHRADGAECLPLFAALGSQPVGAFENLAMLYATVHGRTGEPSEKCIRVVRDLLLCDVDRRLQAIYRDRFDADPPKPGTSHEQKIAALEVTRQDVSALVNSYDWHWLANWLDIGRVGETAESCVRRLANFAFSIDYLFFLSTLHCNISCAHCYNNSGPHKKAKRIPLDRMLALVKQMPGAGITRLDITGGEPFLYPHDLLAIIAAGRVAGLDGISLNTNGFWASTDDRARQMLDRLARAGFMQGREDKMKISGGVYHQEFINFERVLTAARNYYDQFGKPALIDFEMPPQGGQAAADEVRNRVGAAGLTERVQINLRQILPHGRGEHIAGRDIASSDGSCLVMNGIHIDPDETAQPCAGLNYENNGIVFGRSDQHDLKTLVKRMQNDPILQFLATNPMDQIFAYVAKEKKPGGYNGICELCKHALGDLSARELVQAALFAQQKFYPFWFTLVPDHEKVPNHENQAAK
ncbi:MAG: radical SAM protein [Candidatus Binatia bacterium]